MRLTKKGFVAWLRSKRPTSTVGLCILPNKCPIARYLRETYGEEVEVYSEAFGGHPMPAWARALVWATDDGKRDGQRITAGRVLALLGEKP